jgi:hypothetical protein
MSTKSRERIYGTTIRMSAEHAKEARKDADRLACEAWNYRMLGYKEPAQPSPTVTLDDVVQRPKATPIHELERYIRCKDC